MTLFRYLALNEDGLNISGEIEADNERSARRLLQNQGLFVSNLNNTEASFSLNHLKSLSLKEIMSIEIGASKVPYPDLVAFSRQFATLVEAGVPVLQSIDVMIEQTDCRPLERILKKVRTDINEGKSLANALKEHPKCFNDLYTNMILAAEASGRLGAVLSELADTMEERQRITSQLRSAMTYPAVMLVVGFLVIAFLLVKVVPNITSMYQDTGNELPGATKLLLTLSNGLQIYGISITVLIFVIIGAFKITLKKHEKTAFMWDKLKLNLPLFGTLSNKAILTRITTTLASLLKAGVPIITTLKIVQEIVPSRPYHQALKEITKDVSEGVYLSEALAKQPLFPKLLINIVAVGEKSGTLDDMMGRLGLSLQEELRARISGLTSLVQPLLLLLMGGLIAFIMGAVLLPIFEMNTLAGG